jgi:hypothetical protein
LNMDKILQKFEEAMILLTPVPPPEH